MRRWADAESARDAAILLPFLAAVLLLPPFILLFAVPVHVAGVPLIVIYIFGAWAAIVAAAWWVARNHAIIGQAPDGTRETEAETAGRSASGQARR
jgi:hypothetical protein